MNIAGEKIAAKVSYTIDGKQLEANTNEATDIRALRLRSGQHSMTAICGEYTIRRQFVVFTLQDKKAPIETHDWFYQSSSNFPATIQVGSSDEEHHIYYTILTSICQFMIYFYSPIQNILFDFLTLLSVSL